MVKCNMQSSFKIEDGTIKNELVKENIINPLKYDTYIPPENIEVTVNYNDIYQLGDHRLMCGDSTKEEDIQLLMDNNKADITFSSPPYNTGGAGGYAFDKLDPEKYDSSFYGHEGVYNSFTDDLSDEDYSNLLINSAKYGLKYSDNVLFNMGVLKGNKKGIINLLFELKNNFCDILIWDKGNNAIPYGLPSQKGLVKHDGEFIFCFNQTGNRSFNHSTWSIGTQSNIIRHKNASRNKFSKYHKGTFPLGFAVDVVRDFCECSVLDLFGGVGTTLIASEFLKRKCYMMEIDPLYCQIIINRWEHYTNRKVEKVDGVGL